MPTSRGSGVRLKFRRRSSRTFSAFVSLLIEIPDVSQQGIPRRTPSFIVQSSVRPVGAKIPQELDRKTTVDARSLIVWLLMDTSDPKPLNILSLDGGGVRGLSSLLILEALMQRIAISIHSPTVPRPCEVFDLICGTSTGGLIAIMLGRLRMSVEDAIKGYLQFSQKIFGHKRSFPWIRRLAGSAMYDASTLEECVKEIVAKFGGHDGDAPLEDPMNGQEEICRTFVVAILQNFANAPPSRLRTYTTKEANPEDTCKIWEAARATTAASTFFDPMSIGFPPQIFLDAGLSGANNPSAIARDEVREIFPGRPIGCFLSLGTGVPSVVEVQGNLIKIAEACVKLSSDCELANEAVSRIFRRETAEGQKNPYFRFSVNKGLETIVLDEWERIQELTAITLGYMRFDVQQERAEKCVEVLKVRAAEAMAKKEEDARLL